jgi:adenylyltransferase/sulfurtransferase
MFCCAPPAGATSARSAIAFPARSFETNGTLSSSRNSTMKVLIPTPLRQYADKKPAVEVNGHTVGDALKALTSQHSDLQRHLYSDDGRLRSFVNVYLNDEDIRFLEKENTPVKESDTISIVPSIAGGEGQS